MASFLSAKFTKYGLLEDDDSPSTRVFVSDVSDESEAAIRQAITRDQDTDGAGVFAGFRSELGLASNDVSGLSQIETWMSGLNDVEMVGVTPDHIVQWYNASRILGGEQLDTTETNLAESMAMMVQDGGDQATHDVFATRNGLQHLAPENGGWADTDSDNTPDGYTTTSLTSEDFTSNVYAAFVDTTAGTGSLNATFAWPLDSVDVTLSVQVDQVHDDGTNAVRVEALDSDKSTVQDSAESTFSSTGRKSVTLTTPSNTYYLKVYPIRVSSVTANTAKFNIQDPALRVDGETTYVKR